MAWVRSEYAGALAVLCTWAAAVLPWSVTYFSVGSITQVLVRVHWGVFKFQFGAPEDLVLPSQTVLAELDTAANPGIRQATLVWIGAAAVMTALVAFSVAYYLREERVEALPVDPVRLTGGALLVVAVAHAASLWLLLAHRAGTTVPVGAVFEFVFAYLLLTVDRQPGD